MPDSAPWAPPIDPGGIRPIILALAPAPAGSSRTDLIPSLTMLGGRRLIDHLLARIAGMGFRSPLVAARTEVAARLQRELGTDTEVIGADGDRLDVLQAALPEVPGPLVMIHDAERALTPAGTVRDVLGALTTGVDAVVPVQAMTDSVKEVTPDGLRNVDRATLAALQSPRLLRREALEAALRATPTPTSTLPPPPPARAAGGRAGQRARDEILELLAQGSTVHTVAGSHSGFAVVDRLSLWQAQISLGLERDTSSRHRASLRP